MSVSKRLAIEVRLNSHVDGLEEIHERWRDDPATGEDGYITRLEACDFRAGQPDWLSQHVDDVIEAAWVLGYTKAGVQKSAEPEADMEQVRAMFE